MNSKRRYIYVDSSSSTATSSIPYMYQSSSPQEALRGRYGYTFPMTKASSVGFSEACYFLCARLVMHAVCDIGMRLALGVSDIPFIALHVGEHWRHLYAC